MVAGRMARGGYGRKGRPRGGEPRSDLVRARVGSGLRLRIGRGCRARCVGSSSVMSFGQGLAVNLLRVKG
jgi:hypothetical protein